MAGSFRFNGPLQTYVEVELSDNRVRALDQLFEGQQRFLVYAEFQPSGIAKASVFYLEGDAVDFVNVQVAEQLRVEPAIELKLGRHLNVKLDHKLRRLDVAGGELFEANLSQLRLVYQFNRRLFLRTILQYQRVERDLELFNPASQDQLDVESEDLFSQLLLSYTVNPQTVVFVGYSDNQQADDMTDLYRTDRSLFIKMGYAWTR